MLNKQIDIEITGISNLGQGFALARNGKKIFVSKTLPGDKIQAKVTKETSKFTSAHLIKIISSSDQRRTAPCEYFNECGGCSLQHLQENYYQEFKQKSLDDLLKRAQVIFLQKVNWVFIGQASRRRAVFQIDKDNRLGFFREYSNDVVKINNCLILENELSSLIPQLQNLVSEIKNINSISITKFDNGIAIILHSKQEVNLKDSQYLASFAKVNNIISLSYKIGNDCNLICQSQIPQLFFGNLKIDLSPDIFLQATKKGQDKIIEEINGVVSSLFATRGNPDSLNIIDLYCGIGTYSFYINDQNKNARIVAYEGSEKMIASLNKNSAQNNLNIKGFARDLVKNPLRLDELKNCDLSIINPPRNGAEAQIKNLARSTIKNIIYISCNPSAFANDAKILLQAGCKISKIIAIDQFCYNHHIELVAVFSR